MNPLASEALGSIVRSILKIGAGYLVGLGVWTEGEAVTYVAAAALAIVGFGWSYWTTHNSRLKLLTGLSMSKGSTEAQVEAQVKAGNTPPVTLAKTDVPT